MVKTGTSHFSRFDTHRNGRFFVSGVKIWYLWEHLQKNEPFGDPICLFSTCWDNKHKGYKQGNQKRGYYRSTTICFCSHFVLLSRWVLSEISFLNY